jgi:hypothetical protein
MRVIIDYILVIEAREIRRCVQVLGLKFATQTLTAQKHGNRQLFRLGSRRSAATPKIMSDITSSSALMAALSEGTKAISALSITAHDPRRPHHMAQATGPSMLSLPQKYRIQLAATRNERGRQVQMFMVNGMEYGTHATEVVRRLSTAVPYYIVRASCAEAKKFGISLIEKDANGKWVHSPYVFGLGSVPNATK